METISIVGPESAVAAVPHILGFAPRHSIVILWIADGAVVVAQRADLPVADQDAWTDALVKIAGRVNAEAALDIWVDRAVPSESLVASLHEACERRGVRVVATVATDGQSWIEEGPTWGRRRRLPDALRWRAPRREDFSVAPASDGRLIRRVRPLDEADVDSVVATLRDPSVPESASFSTPEARRVVSALQVVGVRDELLWHVCAEPTGARALAVRLATLLRGVGPRATGQVAITAAMAFWVAGDGYRASVVLERALTDAPNEPLGHMLDAALRSGIPPKTWVQAVQNTPYELCRRARACA
jgi:hypothetical protein